MTTDRKAIVSLTITDRGALQAAFMSFVEGGGVFVPTTQQYTLGDSVFLLFGLMDDTEPVSYTHLRAHETPEHLVCRLLLEKKK